MGLVQVSRRAVKILLADIWGSLQDVVQAGRTVRKSLYMWVAGWVQLAQVKCKTWAGHRWVAAACNTQVGECYTSVIVWKSAQEYRLHDVCDIATQIEVGKG